MIRVVLEGPNRVSVQEVPTPSPGPSEVLISVKACGICGSDVSAYQGKHPFVRYPVVQGHEFSGEIAGLGESVDQLKKGDKVVVEPSLTCGTCYHCKTGRYNVCNELAVLGFQADGAMAEYFVANSEKTYRIPPEISFEDAALVEPAAVALHAVRGSNLRVGDNVLIIGAGTIGLMLLQCCKAAGASSTIVTDLIDFRLDIARRLGADYTMNVKDLDPVAAIRSEFGRDWVDVVFEASGSMSAMNQAIEVVRKGSEIVVVGIPPKEVSTEIALIQDRELLVKGSLMYSSRDYSRVIEMMARGKIGSSGMITHRFSLRDLYKAYQTIEEQPERVLKVMIQI